MNVAYWTLAALLAAFYLYGGGVKAVRSRERLRPMMGWVDDMPMAAVRALGAVEVAGAAGLVLPPLTGIAPWLALAAAAGFTVLQAGAIRVHLARGDRRIALNIVLVLASAATVATATTWL
ncbi:DoxX family protein [Streptomyces montanisoli]|uniref:DoxX family protein n=1 Tax=Streptomyces montanisoli TaxID=2798581 RepID=A0A940MKT7_9ACTN|nr:DoxX family protein [Streptomyces montanisoli]MBP0461637.1 DoxX family protein [Streptomyces montanisoli]